MKTAFVFIATIITFAAFGGPPPTQVEGTIRELRFFVIGQDYEHSSEVYLGPPRKMCGTTWMYAYLSDKDENYATIVQALISAKATKAPVVVLSLPDSKGYCKLVSIWIM